jgi:hypothetical protein
MHGYNPKRQIGLATTIELEDTSGAIADFMMLSW